MLRRLINHLINGEIAIGWTFATLFWIGVLGWATSYDPTNPEKEACYQAAAKSGRSTDECKSFWEQTTSQPVAMFTLVLAGSTIGLWVATGIGIISQSRQTRIIERAFISVEPAGISPFSGDDDRIACDVFIHNAGNLPATNMSWDIRIKYSKKPRESSFDWDKLQKFGKIVLAPKGRFKKGADPTTITDFNSYRNGAEKDKAWLYIWGHIHYHDGFQDGRWIRFCHRYNLRGADGYTIPEEKGRYHENGNRTDESV
jgi:hypothetical protein